MYDGLVEYGPDGTILPSLAASWTVDDAGTGQRYTFNLRKGVTFHDGTAWNCAAAKLNFDHVLADPLTTGDWHGWYGLPGAIDSWKCVSDFVFEITTGKKYYPLLQELTYIRPLRMLSPNKFVGGPTSDPYTSNSCPVGWGTITHSDGGGPSIECKGTTGISGTGRWQYVETVKNGDDVQEVIFKRNDKHWDASSDAVEFVKLVHYGTHDDVKNALLDGSLDAVIGDGVLKPSDVAAFRSGKHGNSFHVSMTEPMQNRIVVLNTAKAPTNDINLRRTMIHAVNKAAIIDKELAGLDEPVDSLFGKNAPYCHVDLTPRWDYDFEKAKLLNCNAPESGLSDGATAGGHSWRSRRYPLCSLHLYEEARDCRQARFLSSSSTKTTGNKRSRAVQEWDTDGVAI